jgi:hypothetical protein
MSVPILSVRDKDGNIIPVPAIVGPKPIKGVDYWTAEDKAEMENAASNAAQAKIDAFLANCTNVAEEGM